ncbi:hypothetical protein [Microseira wollei]|nr:hypothetical protein [Microseira wollei]
MVLYHFWLHRNYDGAVGTITNYQLPITNYQLPTKLIPRDATGFDTIDR